MLARPITPADYARVLPDATTPFFISPRFLALNARKASAVHYLSVGPGVIALGESIANGLLSSPWSAPYAPLHPELLARFPEAIEALRAYAASRSLTLRLTLPPTFLSPAPPTLLSASDGWNDINFHIDADTWSTLNLHRDVRRMLRRADESGQTASTLPLTELPRVYAIVDRNHRERGYPVAMSLDDVEATATLVPTSLHVVTSPDEGDVAAAIWFHVAPRVAHAVLWGNLTHSTARFPMYQLARHAVSTLPDLWGIRWLDLGPAAIAGEIDRGLARFKRHIGAIESIKPTRFF
ncbi:MAG: hypothetical protein K2M04_02250 [Muribaculaceae bacterium]|nr:hypothetical protein [Muribaculaceae bacterium]